MGSTSLRLARGNTGRPVVQCLFEVVLYVFKLGC